jgi:outer membrane protein
MKKFSVLCLLFISINVTAQTGAISLKECINAAIANKSNIKSTQASVLIAGLQQNEAMSRYLPEISLAYDYRYNPIISTQVIPSGQFLPVPTNELRAVQFGTKWTQNAGLTVYQPIIDFSLKSRVEESRINERVKNADLKVAEEDLAYEVIKTFSRIMQFEEQRASAIVDTARTYETLTFINNRYTEGKILKTELNKAFVNHHKSVLAFRTALADLVKEKFYLSYLTSIPVTTLMERPYDFSPLQTEFAISDRVFADSTAGYQQISARQDLLLQQAKTTKNKSAPTFGFDGFLGANQFTNEFAPFKSNTWFGNSYLGISIKYPILSGENRKYKLRQQAIEREALEFDKEELRNKLTRDYRQAMVESQKTKLQIETAVQNVSLLEENVGIYRERVNAGKENAHELLIQEFDLQIEKANLLKLKADYANKEVERLKASGQLMEFVRKL